MIDLAKMVESIATAGQAKAKPRVPAAHDVLNAAKALAGPGGWVALALPRLMGRWGYSIEALVTHAIAAEGYAFQLEQEVRRLRRELDDLEREEEEES